MKITKAELDARAEIKLNKNVKTSTGLGIMTFGDNNDYPEIIERLILGSIDAKATASIYQKFIVGGGFVDQVFNNTVVSTDYRGKEVTINILLRKIAQDLSYYNGCFVHVNRNLAGNVITARHIPFKWCRFAEVDTQGYTSKILVNQKWGQTGFKKQETQEYPIFTTNENAFYASIKKYGSIDKYPGEIYFHFQEDSFLYPLSPYDPVYMDCSTQAEVQVFRNNSIRNGMTEKTLLYLEQPKEEEQKEIVEKTISNLLGANGDSVVAMFVDAGDGVNDPMAKEAIKAVPIKSNINDKLYESWGREISNSIRKANKALPSILIDYEQSNLGNTSGESIQQAVNFYNAMTSDDRKGISQMFFELFGIYSEIQSIQLEVAEQLDTISSEKLKSQAVLRGSVGGVQALLQIQQSVANGVTDRSAGIAIINEIFGIDTQRAEEILGTPKENAQNGTTNIQPTTGN